MAPPAVPRPSPANVDLEAAAGGAATTPAPLDASKLTYTLTQTPRAVPSQAAATAGDETVASDHMITATWHASRGWSAPELKPYGPLALMPTASCLHYATACFEGLKVYRGHDGKLRLFRPGLNCARMRLSAARISLPVLDAPALERLIAELLAVDGPRWLPADRPGAFLYVRPTLIGTQAQLGVQAPREALLYVLLTVFPRLDAPPGGMRLRTSPGETVRAWVGGFGHAKVGANYGPSLAATEEARRGGHHQVLWLYGERGECTEAGASNLFVVWRRRGDGGTEVVTAPLDDKLILDGVTRRSCLELLRGRLAREVEVSERKYTVGEVAEAEAEGRILECWAAGTAYFICPVSQIHHRGRDIHIPMGEDGHGGEITAKVKTWIGDIMYGREQHEWGVVIPERGQ